MATVTDIYEYLEGYSIDATSIPPEWIEKRIANEVVPFVEKHSRTSVTGEEEKTEYYSGNGTDVLMLKRKQINSVSSVCLVYGSEFGTIGVGSYEVIEDEGIIKLVGSLENRMMIFPKGKKNIKVTFKYGFDTAPDDLNEAVILLACELTLGHLANRTGGGNLNTQGFNRDQGNRGKYTNIRNEMANRAIAIIRRYSTGVN